MGGCTWNVLGIPGYHVLRDWGGSIWGEVPWMSLVSRDTMFEGLGVYMGGCTWDVLGIPGYYDCIEVYGGMYLGCTWYPGIQRIGDNGHRM